MYIPKAWLCEILELIQFTKAKMPCAYACGQCMMCLQWPYEYNASYIASYNKHNLASYSYAL